MKHTEILIVDDDPGAIQLMTRMLSGTGHVRFATNGKAALRLAQEKTPDLILLDAEMPGMSGFEVCTALKADALLAQVPVVFITGHSHPSFELSGFEVGAADFISKPVSEPVVMARVQTQLRLKQLHDELLRIATVDALTGVANRRQFDTVLDREWRRAQRDGKPMALLMIDVDHFKRFNDHHGHPAGDAALQSVALAIGAVCQRPADLVARYGGEEFALLLPDTPCDGARLLAHRILSAVAALQLPHGDSPTAAHVTLSIGVSCSDAGGARRVEQIGDHFDLRLLDLDSNASHLVAAADKALYAAKQHGRCCAYFLDMAEREAPTGARRIDSVAGSPLAAGVSS